MVYTEHRNGRVRKKDDRKQGQPEGHCKGGHVECVFFSVPAGTVAQGCGLRIEPSPATLALSSPQLELHHWPHCPRVRAHTHTHTHTHTQKKINYFIKKPTTSDQKHLIKKAQHSSGNRTFFFQFTKSTNEQLFSFSLSLKCSNIVSTSYCRPPPRASRSRWRFFSNRSEPRGLGWKKWHCLSLMGIYSKHLRATGRPTTIFHCLAFLSGFHSTSFSEIFSSSLSSSSSSSSSKPGRLRDALSSCLLPRTLDAPLLRGPWQRKKFKTTL